MGLISWWFWTWQALTVLSNYREIEREKENERENEINNRMKEI